MAVDRFSIGQMIDARAPLVNAYLDAIIDAANTQARAPLEVLAQHLGTGSGLFSDRVARNVAGFALPLEFASEILQAASLPLGRPLVVPPNRLELPPFWTPEMTDDAGPDARAGGVRYGTAGRPRC